MMKTKSFRRILGIAFAIVLILSCVGPASAAANLPGNTDAVSAYLSSSTAYPGGIYAVMKTGTDAVDQQDISGTDIYHVFGRSVSYSFPEEETYTASLSGNLSCNGAAQLGADIATSAGYAFAGSLFGQLDVEMSVTYTINPNYSYILDADEATGVYHLAVFFPGKTVVKQVTGINANQITWVLWEETIEFAPLPVDSTEVMPYVDFVLN